MTTPGPSADTTLADAAQRLGLALPAADRERLLAYLALLQRWNRVYNLTAVRDPQAMLTQHLLDCLSALGPLQAWAGQAPAGLPRQLLDVGSGGGLPGVVFACLMPGWQVHCVDTVAKKASFIRQVAAELGLPNLHGQHTRVEAWHPAGAGFGLITSRAFASLADFTRLTSHLLAPQGVWMAMKGQTPVDEMAALPADVAVFHVEQLLVPGLQAQRCLVWMRPA